MAPSGGAAPGPGGTHERHPLSRAGSRGRADLRPDRHALPAEGRARGQGLHARQGRPEGARCRRVGRAAAGPQAARRRRRRDPRGRPPGPPGPADDHRHRLRQRAVGDRDDAPRRLRLPDEAPELRRARDEGGEGGREDAARAGEPAAALPGAERPLLRHPDPLARHAADPAHDRDGRRGPHARADRGRERRREGAARAARAPALAARAEGVRGPQLRGRALDAARERAVRLRARGVHGRRQREARPGRGGRRGHALPRRGRGDDPRDPVEVPARARLGHVLPRGRDAQAARRLPPGVRDQPRPEGRGRRRPLPQGPLLPRERRQGRDPAAARASRGHPAARGALRPAAPEPEAARPRGARGPRGATTGRATCASCTSPSSARGCSPRGR